METTSTRFFIPVLSIAGSDPSGGAGIQQDIKTCEAHGCYGMAAITALTAQSPTKVTSLYNTSRFLEAQLNALLDEVRPGAVKIGMVPDVESVEIIANAIKIYKLENIVIDPVMASTSGHILASESAVSAMRQYLFPLAFVVTPNIPEAEILIGKKVQGIEDSKYAAKAIATTYGCPAVLVKGGHSKDMVDILYLTDTDIFHSFPTEIIDTLNTHGTGCRLSTSIACGLAKDLTPEKAILSAKEWLTEDLRKNAFMKFPPIQ